MYSVRYCDVRSLGKAETSQDGYVMVACTRLELVLPDLKGRFPVPLEEHAMFGSPTEGRTPVCTLRGCCPVLLDDRAIGGGQEIRTLISLLARQVASH